MSKNHRKNLEKAFGKKTKYTAENLHDDHDLFDARRSKNLDDSQYESLLHESGNYKKSV
jgi:predicted nucleotidyltransferase